MNVVLVNSPWIHDRERYSVKAGARWAHVRSRRKTIPYYPFPFAMAYATAQLQRNGYRARLLDAVALEMDTSQTLDEIHRFQPGLVVIETSTPSVAMDLEFARLVRGRLDSEIVYSGPHATALPEEVLEEGPGIAVLRGEYDFTLLELAEALKNQRSLKDIEGISWRDGEMVRNNPDRPLIQDLDALPYPVRDELPMNRYTDPSCKLYPNVSIITSRGCPFKCIFCLESTVLFHSPSFRRRDPDKVVDEMEFVVQNYDAREIYFDDSSFTADVNHARAVSRAIIDRGLKIAWSCMADARVDYDTLKMMRQSGCTGLKYGVETADPDLMKTIRKKLDLERVRRFADDCRKLGLYTHGTFMFGLPGETRRSIERTLEFAFSLNCTTAQFSVATPFPGTEFYEMAKRNGWLITDDWSMYDGGESPVVSYPECSRDDIIAGLEKAKKRKILRMIRNPVVLAKYICKLYRIEGFSGLLHELSDKAGYLVERRK
ncbi:radical SAM protein [bacterium]|nr:radical SAM protein [candidate division CSSED10-310 bacterium]